MKIVFATNNQHKLEEVRAILGAGIEVVSLADIGCHEDIPETGKTLEENALMKAQYVYDHYHLSCLPTTLAWKWKPSMEHLACIAPAMPLWSMLQLSHNRQNSPPAMIARLTWPVCCAN